MNVLVNKSPKLKRFLLIPMCIIELFALLMGWVIAFIHKPTAKSWTDWCIKNFPDADWYLS